MGTQFSAKEQYAIAQKQHLISKMQDGTLTSKEISDLITARRVSWITEKKSFFMEEVYKGSDLPLVQIAHRILYFNHMHMDEETSETELLNDKMLRIRSSNFCPYLEVCKNLDLNTKDICQDINEQGIQEFLKVIDPRLEFSRDYHIIRPFQPFCMEYITLRE